jgi:serine protease inhibitor
MTAAPDLRFVLDLHRELAADPADGFVWSPYSVAAALGVAADGAAGVTRDEIAAALTAAGDLGALGKALLAAASLDDLGDGGIAVANTLWADATLPVSAAYAAAVRAWPGGGARTADFRHAPDAARGEINADVERTTHGLITDLLAPEHITRDTRAVLVNALWLKVGWLGEFDPRRTRPARFHSPGGAAEVPTMHRQSRLPYATGNGWTRVGLPADGGLRADVLLPDGDLAAAEAALTPAALADLLEGGSREVALSLPRFRVESTAGLVPGLAALGVRTVFTGAADLSPITGGAEPLKVDKAVHRAVLTVDETGLEGAAATALMMTRTARMVPERPVEVRVDRPFLILVRDPRSGAVYFLARVTRPS